MTDIIELYGARLCPYTQRTRIVLREKQLPYEWVEIDLANKPDWFLELSSYGKVPVVRHHDHLICESDIINEYFEEVFPGRPLLPEDPYLRAQIRIWIAYCNSEFIPSFYQLLASHDPQQQALLRAQLMKVMLRLEYACFASGGSEYLIGDTVSLADICFYPVFERFIVNQQHRQLQLPTECQRLSQWIARLRERDSVKITANTPEFYLAQYASDVAYTHID